MRPPVDPCLTPGAVRNGHTDRCENRPGAGTLSPAARAWCLTPERDASGHARPQRDRPRNDVVDRVAELLQDEPARRGCAEVLDRDGIALVADPLLPAEGHARLDGEPRLRVGRQNVVAIVGG